MSATSCQCSEFHSIKRVVARLPLQASRHALAVTGGLYAKLILMLHVPGRNRPLMLQFNRFFCFVLFLIQTVKLAVSWPRSHPPLRY